MHTVLAPTRVMQMSLPPWAADAAGKILDADNLLFLEGWFEGQPVLILGRLHIVEEATRIEFVKLAVILDTAFNERVDLDFETGRMYKLTELVSTEGGDALSTTGDTD